LALVDGPLPIGDIVAVVFVVAAGIAAASTVEYRKPISDHKKKTNPWLKDGRYATGPHVDEGQGTGSGHTSPHIDFPDKRAGGNIRVDLETGQELRAVAPPPGFYDPIRRVYH